MIVEWIPLLFIIFTVINSAYYIYFLRGFIKYRTPVLSADLPPVSVIVASHNQKHNLPALINALLDQDYPNFEVVIIDDRSDDGSQAFLTQKSQQDPRIKIIRVAEVPDGWNPKKYAITRGIERAINEHLLFTDADCIPNSSHWIHNMISGFSHKSGMVLGYSQHLKKPGFLNYFIRYETVFTALQYLGFALNGHPYLGVGRNLAYRKSVFNKHKGFDGIEWITGGDDDLLVQKLRNSETTSVVMGNEAQVITHAKDNWREFIRQKKRHMRVGMHYKLSDRFFLGLFYFSATIWWALFLLILINNYQSYHIFIALIVRLLIQYFTFALASKKLGNNFNWWAIAFMDFIFVFYYLVTGMLAVVTKKNQWT